MHWDFCCILKVCRANSADGWFFCWDCSSFAGEVYILASSKSMAQSHSGKLYKLVDPKRYKYEAHIQPFSELLFSHHMFVDLGGKQSGPGSISKGSFCTCMYHLNGTNKPAISNCMLVFVFPHRVYQTRSSHWLMKPWMYSWPHFTAVTFSRSFSSSNLQHSHASPTHTINNYHCE